MMNFFRVADFGELSRAVAPKGHSFFPSPFSKGAPMKRNTTALIVAMQVLILMGQWFGNNSPQRAMAQIADSGAQRAQMIEQLKDINTKLDQLIQLLSTGKLQVPAGDSDDKKADH
jgi:hypothetical protein